MTSLGKFVKDVDDTFGTILLSPEFMDKFYAVVFTLSPDSEKRFGDMEKQKKVSLVTSESLLNISIVFPFHAERFG